MSSLPTPYTRQADFTGWEAAHPATPKRATDLNLEYNLISLSITQTQARLYEIQRDDGQLRNGTVHPETLSADALLLFKNATAAYTLGLVLQPGAGSVPRLAASKMADRIHIRDYGAVCDGVADDSAALENAINAANGKAVDIDGTVLVTRPLVLTVTKYAIQGPRNENAAWDSLISTGQATASILYQPSSSTASMISASSAVAPLSGTVGPFTHRNLHFEVGGATQVPFFRFGDPTENPVTPSANQRYVVGVLFERCGFEGLAETISGTTLTRSNVKMVEMTKCFETRFETCSFRFGDTHARFYGCDKVIMDGCRFESSFIHARFDGSAAFQVQHVMNGCEHEDWGIAAVVANDCTVAVDNVRLENTPSPATSIGITVLAATATCATGSNAITMSTSVDNILFPDLSVIRITNASGIECDCHVKTVAGTAVTVYNDGFDMPLTHNGAGLQVSRIHGYGVLYRAGTNSGGCSVSHASCAASVNVPMFIYSAGRAGMTVDSALAVRGSSVTMYATVCGNRQSAASYLDACLKMSNCDPLVMGHHPWIKHIGSQNRYTYEQWRTNYSAHMGSREEDRAKVLRSWMYAPGYSGTAASSQHLVRAEQYPGNNVAFTAERVWGWYLKANGAPAAADDFDVCDETLPESGYVKFTVRAKGLTGAATLSYSWRGNGGSGAATIALTNAWAVYEVYAAVPAQWTTGNNVDRGIRFIPDTAVDIAIAGVVIEETTEMVGSATWNPPSIANGAASSTTVTVTGAALGDFAVATFSLDLQGLVMTAYVSAANTVTVSLANNTGGAIDLASGTAKVRVRKQ